MVFKFLRPFPLRQLRYLPKHPLRPLHLSHRPISSLRLLHCQVQTLWRYFLLTQKSFPSSRTWTTATRTNRNSTSKRNQFPTQASVKYIYLHIERTSSRPKTVQRMVLALLWTPLSRHRRMHHVLPLPSHYRLCRHPDCPLPGRHWNPQLLNRR